MEWNSMTLEERVAQLFTFSAYGPELDEQTQRLVAELKVGGIFLGTGCLVEPAQVHRLTSSLQASSLESGSGIPLFISADFVAGAGCKLSRGAIHFPKNRALGQTNDEQLAYASGRVTATESLGMGVNFNYSPVVDINNNPKNPVIGTHAFGSEAETVIRLGTSVIRGYQEHGLIATAKHFPGHGDTHVDSHHDLPVLPFGAERLERFELAPFRAAIEAGVEAVMVGHIAVPAIDPSGLPASLSPVLTGELLREHLGFDGLIVTDGLSMKGITNQFSMEEACIRAVLAGSDILLGTAESYEQAASMLQAVVGAVRDGRISEARIDASCERILRLKRKYGLTKEAYAPSVFRPELYQAEENSEISRQVAEKAITPWGRVERGMLQGEESGAGWTLLRTEALTVLGEDLRARLQDMDERIAFDREQLLLLLETLPQRRKVIVALDHSKPLPADWLRSLSEALAKREHAIWVHFGSEYDVESRPGSGLLLYDRAPSLQRAAADYVLGVSNKSQSSGK